MKKSFDFAAFFALLLLFAPAGAGALEISIAGGAGNSGFSSSGGLPKNVYPAFAFGLSGEMREGISAGFEVEQDAVFGRKIAAALSYDAGLISLKMGPVFGFLNGTEGNSIKNGLLQPGLRLGLSLFFLKRITIEASSDFCIQSGEDSSGIMYPAESQVAIGVVFPAIVLSLGISQKRASVSGDSGYTQVRTDYGIYTRFFDKSSPIRIGASFIYRTLDYESDALDNSASSLVLGAGVEARVKIVDIFLDFEGSVYTFDDGGENPFLFNAMAGVRIRTR